MIMVDYTHELKIWPKYFDAVSEGRKKFEIRSTRDRVFEVGQHILLREYDPLQEVPYTGRWIHIQVTYVTENDTPFLPKDTCVFSFTKIRRGNNAG